MTRRCGLARVPGSGDRDRSTYVITATFKGCSTTKRGHSQVGRLREQRCRTWTHQRPRAVQAPRSIPESESEQGEESTHDSAAAARADRIVYLHDGELIDELRFAQLLEDDGIRSREEVVQGWLRTNGF